MADGQTSDVLFHMHWLETLNVININQSKQIPTALAACVASTFS